MTELQEKFLRLSAAQLPLERVVEVHLFPPIRNGGMETGIAIVTVALADVPDEPPVAAEMVDADAPADVAREDGACDLTEDAAGAAPGPDDAVAGADDPLGIPEPAEPIDADDDAPAPRVVPRRHTVYTARYRATLKGPDRGKFEVEVQAEADAPLVTIEAVVRGVQKRANEPAEAERLPGDALRVLVERANAAAPPGSSGRAA